jgi:sulfite oxidase
VGVTGGAAHVELIGLDQVEREGERFGFGGSVDLAKAMGDEVLLATHLNGAPLPPKHGFPLRAVIPGWIGARSVKWLGQVNLRADPTPNYFQTQAYRVQRQADPRNPRDVSRGEALSEVPVNAVILQPLTGQRIASGRSRLRGWAMGSAGRRVTLVEVSINDGRDWISARILPQESAWTWAFWEAAVDLAPGDPTLVVRATDSSNATQPAAITETWNVKGYCNNAWHRVPIVVE